jgi:hypothetical protein
MGFSFHCFPHSPSGDMVVLTALKNYTGKLALVQGNSLKTERNQKTIFMMPNDLSHHFEFSITWIRELLQDTSTTICSVNKKTGTENRLREKNRGKEFFRGLETIPGEPPATGKSELLWPFSESEAFDWKNRSGRSHKRMRHP